jgi:surface antigen
VTTRVTTSRGFVVAYRSPFIEGKLGKEEQVPIHAKGVELLVRQQWQNRTSYMVVNNVLTEVLCVNNVQGAPGVLAEGSDQPRTGRVGLENTTPASLPGGGGSSNEVTAAAHTSAPSGAEAVSAGEHSPAISTTSAAAEGGGAETGLSRRSTRPADDGGPNPEQRQSKRQRRHRQPHNAAVLGGETVKELFRHPPDQQRKIDERLCYLAADALGTEVDDTDSAWDEAKKKEMYSYVVENNTYRVASSDFVKCRKALPSMWVCSAKADGRMKACRRGGNRICKTCI